MADWMETHRAVVFPWNCDHLGHLNVRWYGHFFDDAGFHLWSKIGLSHATLQKSGVGTVVARISTDFLHEAAPGELLVIESAFTRLGGKSLTMSQRMTNAETGILHARQEVVEVFFDYASRESTAMPPDIREKLAAVLVTEG